MGGVLAVTTALGVKHPERMIGVLQRLGRRSALVFYGDDGLDELSTTGPSTVYRLAEGDIESFRLNPSDLGLAPSTLEDLAGGDAATNAAITTAVLAGERGAARDVVVLNAAATLVAAGLAKEISGGVESAANAIDSGAATAVLTAISG